MLATVNYHQTQVTAEAAVDVLVLQVFGYKPHLKLLYMKVQHEFFYPKIREESHQII